MYENYLLNPHAIAAVTSQIEGFRTESEVSPEEIEGWIDEHGSEPKYFRTKGNLARTDPNWLTEVHGAKLLEDLFADLSGSRVAYDKVAYGVEITGWLCDNAREDLEELADLMAELLEKRERSTKESGA
jgi:hypothetical protein